MVLADAFCAKMHFARLDLVQEQQAGLGDDEQRAVRVVGDHGHGEVLLVVLHDGRAVEGLLLGHAHLDDVETRASGALGSEAEEVAGSVATVDGD